MDNMRMMYDLKEKMFDELKELAKKEHLSSGELEMIYKVASAIKNIGKICLMEEGGEYSHAGEWDADMHGSYDRDNSYRKMHYVRGHYSRNSGMSHDDGYSRDHGYSRHGRGNWREEMEQTLDEMMREAEDDRERDAIRRCLEQVKRG